MIGAGVVCPPQKIDFPFSLINRPTRRRGEEEAGAPTFNANEILPAWVLQHSAYALKRSEKKFRERDKTRRASLSYTILRPQIVDAMREALRRLVAISGRPFYTSRHLSGVGANVLTEESRLAAIEVYERWIDYYALAGLTSQLVERSWSASASEARELLQSASPIDDWEHQRQTLLERHPSAGVPEMLERSIAEGVERSRERDERRGREIIADYDYFHLPFSEDPVVQQTWHEFQQLEHCVATLLAS